jgi:hypothetical protein
MPVPPELEPLREPLLDPLALPLVDDEQPARAEPSAAASATVRIFRIGPPEKDDGRERRRSAPPVFSFAAAQEVNAHRAFDVTNLRADTRTSKRGFCDGKASASRGLAIARISADSWWIEAISSTLNAWVRA